MIAKGACLRMIAGNGTFAWTHARKRCCPFISLPFPLNVIASLLSDQSPLFMSSAYLRTLFSRITR
jgi:hypothetical protein